MGQIYTIYRALNTVNGKNYIGFTKNWPERKTAHQRQSKSSPMQFYCAVRKYGWEVFEWSVLFQSWDYDYCLNTMEPYFIMEFDSLTNGYNNNKGGGNNTGPKGRAKSLEHRQKISESLKGRHQSQETRLKKSLSFKGRVQSPEWVEKRLRKNKGMVTVVDVNGVTAYVSVDFYKQQYVGNGSVWCTTRSTEGKKRLQQVNNV